MSQKRTAPAAGGERGRSGAAPGRDQQGFTLLEVLVAVVILGLSYVAVLQSFSLSLRNIVRVDETRRQMFEQSLEFKKMLRSSEESEPESSLLEGPVFREGSRYRLVIVAPEGSDFRSLKLERSL